MKVVKADDRGRLSGFEPLVNYSVEKTPDGVFVLTPVVGVPIALLKQFAERVSDTEVCSHCLKPMRGSAAMNDDPLCHPDYGMDCYRLVTVYQHTMPCLTCIGGEDRS